MGLIENESAVHACVFINYINFVHGVKNKLDEKKSENYIIAKQKNIFTCFNGNRQCLNCISEHAS